MITLLLDAETKQELGNGVLTEAEERAHFGLWAILKSPIIMGTDMTKLKASTLKIIKNKVHKPHLLA